MPTISQDHNKVDSKLVGNNILAMVEENEQLTIPTFIAFVRQEFGYTITYVKHGWQNNRPSSRYMVVGKSQTTYFPNTYKLCNFSFLAQLSGFKIFLH